MNERTPVRSAGLPPRGEMGSPKLLLAAIPVAALWGCLIQRPILPPEFLGFRYEVLDSTAAAAEAFLADDTTAQRVVRERLPQYASHTQVDTLVSAMEKDPFLLPLGMRVRAVLQDAVSRAPGRVRESLKRPEAQHELVAAVVVGLGEGLRRARQERPGGL